MPAGIVDLSLRGRQPLGEREVVRQMRREVFDLKHLPIRLAAGWPELLEPRQVKDRRLAVKKDLLARGPGYRNSVGDDAMGQFDDPFAGLPGRNRKNAHLG